MISPINITGAAMITQISIGVIMVIGALILYASHLYASRGEIAPFPRKKSNLSGLAWIIALFLLATLGLLAFSDEFSKIYKPLFGNASFPLIPWSVGILIVYTINISCATILVYSTGGSRYSPFGPLYFILPTLAIFLREPLGRIIFYLALTSIFFTITLNSFKFEEEDESGSKFAFWFVSILSLLLAVFIGYITRPQ